MTREEKEDRKLELFDNILFGEKMIARGKKNNEGIEKGLKSIQNASRMDRKRPISEMLLMMFRSARRDE